MAVRQGYVDASVVLRRILRQPGSMKEWLNWDLIITSELLELEARRTIDRLRVLGRLSKNDMDSALGELRKYLESFEQVALGSHILRRAAQPLPTLVGALDAIHLATAQVWSEERGERVLLLTHDRQLAIAARACGLDVHAGK
jgi:predicted nucleic acid-binding protein